MPKILCEELWQAPEQPCMIIVTTNSTVALDGRLVMGRGAAKEAMIKIPGIEYDCGQAVQNAGDKYGFLPIRVPKANVGFGIFQVKHHWKDSADLELIKRSAKVLKAYAEANPSWHFRMNYPGIGNGGLLPEQVEPLILWIPGNVTVCYQGKLKNVYGSVKDLYVQVNTMIESGQARAAIEYLKGMDWNDPEGQVQYLVDLHAVRKKGRRG